jgi:hypothetical protein
MTRSFFGGHTAAVEASTNASLDSALAVPRPAVRRPGADDYDAWQAWAMDLMGEYATCEARHAKTVQAWPN